MTWAYGHLTKCVVCEKLFKKSEETQLIWSNLTFINCIPTITLHFTDIFTTQSDSNIILGFMSCSCLGGLTQSKQNM